MKIKNIIGLLSSVLFLCSLLVVSPAIAVRGPQDVTNTPHNLSISGFRATATIEDEICVFCHTPHGGSTDGPLWNRNSSSQTYTHYNSATLSKQVGISRGGTNVSPESMLCLSCHDGSISMFSVLNPTNDAGQPISSTPDPTMRGGIGNDQGPRIGSGRNADGSVNDTVSNQLSDDHPISFVYEDVLNDGSKNNTTKLHTIAEAESAGVRFMPENAPSAQKRVECSSCHDPHVNSDDLFSAGNPAYKPFLITPNAGSALCLACHIK